jgi:hypothetical protein
MEKRFSGVWVAVQEVPEFVKMMAEYGLHLNGGAISENGEFQYLYL